MRSETKYPPLVHLCISGRRNSKATKVQKRPRSLYFLYCSLFFQNCSLHFFTSSVIPTKFSVGSHHSMTGNRPILILSHYVSHRSVGFWVAALFATCRYVRYFPFGMEETILSTLLLKVFGICRTLYI